YTDGLVEARNEIGETFGNERLINCLDHHGASPAPALAEHILHCQRLLQGTYPPTDDPTLVVGGWCEPGESPRRVWRYRDRLPRKRVTLSSPSCSSSRASHRSAGPRGECPAGRGRGAWPRRTPWPRRPDGAAFAPGATVPGGTTAGPWVRPGSRRRGRARP